MTLESGWAAFSCPGWTFSGPPFLGIHIWVNCTPKQQWDENQSTKQALRWSVHQQQSSQTNYPCHAVWPNITHQLLKECQQTLENAHTRDKRRFQPGMDDFFLKKSALPCTVLLQIPVLLIILLPSTFPTAILPCCTKVPHTLPMTALGCSHFKDESCSNISMPLWSLYSAHRITMTKKYFEYIKAWQPMFTSNTHNIQQKHMHTWDRTQDLSFWTEIAKRNQRPVILPLESAPCPNMILEQIPHTCTHHLQTNLWCHYGQRQAFSKLSRLQLQAELQGLQK